MGADKAAQDVYLVNFTTDVPDKVTHSVKSSGTHSSAIQCLALCIMTDHGSYLLLASFTQFIWWLCDPPALAELHADTARR